MKYARMLRGIALPCLAMLFVSPVLAEGKRAVERPCRAATAAVRYGAILRIQRNLKIEITNYRKGWAEACSKGGGASLGSLLVQADRIKTGMLKAIGKSRVRVCENAGCPGG